MFLKERNGIAKHGDSETILFTLVTDGYPLLNFAG